MVRKISDNIQAAELAASKGWYHVAIGRFYYATFERIIVILGVAETYWRHEGNGSHVNKFDDFILYMRRKVSPSDYNILSQLYAFKDERVKADYRTYMHDERAYIIVKRMFDDINKVIDRVNP